MGKFGADVAEDLQLLDVKLKMLKNEYEQYFLGSRRREPFLLRGEVQKMVSYYANVPIRNTGYRFHFNNLRARFFAFRRHWDRILREIEEGRYERQIFQANLGDIDPKFNIEIIGLPWPSFLAAIRAKRLPIFVGGWGEDIHDPHNWAQPFLIGTYAARQRMPDWMKAEFTELVNAGVSAPTPEERAEQYLQIQLKDYEYAPGIRLVVPTGRAYVQRWVDDYIQNPMMRHPFYEYSKK